MRGPTPTATYRFQLTPSFGFDRAIAQLDRLQALGVSHVYLSPVTEAVPGSTHGYDVVDHARVREELGGATGLGALLDSCAERRMGALIDHVPNHTAVGQPELNARWWAMLRDGPASEAARWFDVDWAAADGQVILPVLGAPLDDVVGDLRIVEGELHLGPQRWPLATGTEQLEPVAALERQHYRLQWWRDPARNVRRFFTIDGLVAVRVEDPVVAAVVDTVPHLIADHPGFAGLRIDHVDGLADPLGYLEQLRAAIGDRWLLVEKILAPHETLPRSWPVHGTTGYEHATVLEHALLDRDGWAALRDRWVVLTGDDRPFRDVELEARREVLETGLRPDLERVARAAGADAGAVAELTLHLERYRTYLPDDEGRPALAAALDEPGEWRTRWQQLTGPATAKGVEDRAFWRHLPLASLSEVGGMPEPDLTVDPVAALHDHHARTADAWPATLLAGTTHDTKRGEDVRAAGLALAARSDDVLTLLATWLDGPGAAIALDVATHWLAVQTALTTPGLDVERLVAFLVKAGREAGTRTSWAAPDESYEAQLPLLAGALLDWVPVAERTASLRRPAAAVSLAMLAIRLTAPGVPDLYQGTEAFRYLLVDPDNRAEPDHAALDALVERAATIDGRAAWSEEGAPAARAVLIQRVLTYRHTLDLAAYEPVDAGPDLVAFARTDPTGTPVLLTIVARSPFPRRIVGLEPTSHRENRVVRLPPGPWRHLLLDDEPEVEGTCDVDTALAAFPAIVLSHPSV